MTRACRWCRCALWLAVLWAAGCVERSDLQPALVEWISAWNRHDVQGLEAAFIPGGSFTGLDGKLGPPSAQAGAFTGIWNLVPDARLRPTRWIHTERGLVFSWVIEGSTPSGAPLMLRGMTSAEAENGKIAAMRIFFDARPLLALLQRKPAERSLPRPP